jgi:hypothetical protein
VTFSTFILYNFNSEKGYFEPFKGNLIDLTNSRFDSPKCNNLDTEKGSFEPFKGYLIDLTKSRFDSSKSDFNPAIIQTITPSMGTVKRYAHSKFILVLWQIKIHNTLDNM